ncbi:MAG: type II toxin-antitoxin system RelE/ParE family toxin [Candidatus Solibacter sp.]|nr:type II toxin-antitoxin system RelE/ParE family toxin [Candidatus Solibacter sp.]
MSRFLFGRYVEGDLREIRDYIAKESPESARRLMVRFVGAFRLLANQPELGHVREDLPSPVLRFWPVGSYLVVYLAEKPIEIVAIVHGARDVPSVVNRRL